MFYTFGYIFTVKAPVVYMSLILFIIYLNVNFLKNKLLFKQNFLLFELLLINFTIFYLKFSCTCLGYNMMVDYIYIYILIIIYFD